MAEPVATQHAGANEIIGVLREAATKIKGLGDENLRLEDEAVEGRRTMHRVHDDLASGERAQATLREWTELLCDFRSGIRDRDELLDGTVGKHG